MKFRIIYTLIGLLLFSLVFMASKNGRAFQAGWGNTGAPGDDTQGNGQPRTCQFCHFNSSTIQVTIAIDVQDDTGTSITKYVPGETYNVKVALDGSQGTETPAAYGFQALCLKAPHDVFGDDAASFSNPGGNVRIATASNTLDRQYAEHKGPSASNQFEFQWTAPESGTGEVTFYTCGNGVNGDNQNSGDNAACTTLELEENIVSIKELSKDIQLNIFPNPVQDDLNIHVESLVSGTFYLNIFNGLGNMVKWENLDLKIGENSKQVNLSHLSSGTYFLQLTDGKRVVSRRVLKL